MNHSLVASLLFVALASSISTCPAAAAPRHDHYKTAAPDPAWAFGIEWGGWSNAADPSFLAPKAGPAGGLFVGYRNVPFFEVSAIRMWRPIAVRMSLGRAELDFGVTDLLVGTSARLGTAACDQLRLSALYPVWSVHRSDDRQPGSTQWIVGLFTGPTVGWTRLSDLHTSAEGMRYVGVDRLSVDSGLQAGWETWIGGPVWFDGPLAHTLFFFDVAVVGFGKDLVEIRTTPESAVVSGHSRVAPGTFRIGLALLRNLEPGHP